MAEIINLKRVRKDRARAERDSEAAANRRRFGRTKEQKAADRDQAERSDKSLAGKRLDEKE